MNIAQFLSRPTDSKLKAPQSERIRDYRNGRQAHGGSGEHGGQQSTSQREKNTSRYRYASSIVSSPTFWASITRPLFLFIDPPVTWSPLGFFDRYRFTGYKVFIDGWMTIYNQHHPPARFHLVWHEGRCLESASITILKVPMSGRSNGMPQIYHPRRLGFVQ